MAGTNDQERVRNLEERLRLLSEALRAFAESATDYDRLLDVVARQLSAVVKDACIVRLVSDDGWLRAVAAHLPFEGHGLESEDITKLHAFLAAPHHIDSSPVGKRVVETGEALLVPKLDLDQLRRQATPEIARLYEPIGIHSMLVVAMRARGKTIGLLSIFRFVADSSSLDEHDQHLAQMLADHAALAIANSRLYDNARRELAERERAEKSLSEAEEKLRQAQKMEAVGRLAGGVAHDFNNLLSVILSYSEMMMMEMRVGEPMRDDLKQIREAGQRAAALTRQLLAFSRQQVLEPRVLDVNEIIRTTEKLLQRILGEDVELNLVLDPALRACKVDPGQFEQVLMNLVVNARDAMLRGGNLTIETSNTVLDSDYAQSHPESRVGPHVVLAVSDTGIGMDKPTQARIFEPFFTTKPKDRGTGLGLSTVYGMVKQSGGSVWVYSEPGKGTTFKIYLPSVFEESERSLPPAASNAKMGGTETVLLVEDDPQVRMVARTVLRRAGYNVLEASNGGEALLTCEQHGADIQLLITDVVMPRMSGRELAERLKQIRPVMRVLFMSGYTEDAIVRHGLVQSGINYLQKPITPDSLLRKARGVLDAQ